MDLPDRDMSIITEQEPFCVRRRSSLKTSFSVEMIISSPNDARGERTL
jgi:hypothetical protein